MALNQTESTATTSTPFTNDEMMDTYILIRDSQTKIIPIICSLGFVTNLLSLFVFMQACLRRLSCSVYLASKAVVDFLFLLTVFIIWLTRVDVGAFNTVGICQIVIFLSYLTAFISIWLAVALTVENILCVWKPWCFQRSCNEHTAIIITAIIVVVGVIVYHFSLWNNGVRPSSSFNEIHSGDTDTHPTSDGYLINSTHSDNTMRSDSIDTRFWPITQARSNVSTITTVYISTKNSSSDLIKATVYYECMQLQEFTHIVIAVTYIDSLITLLIPLIILAVANTVIVILAVRATRKRNRSNEEKLQYQLPGAYLANQRTSAAALEAQASKFLFAVSMTTLLFHLPSHVSRLKSLVFGYTSTDILLQRVFETLYYTHYAISFFVYLTFGTNFRRVFLTLLTNCCVK